MKFLIFSIAIILSSCNSKNIKKYGYQYNVERKKIGLPLIPKNWTIEDGKDYIVCLKPYDDNRPKPYYLDKETHFDKKGSAWESDEYVGPGSYTTIDGTFDEMLYITYNFYSDTAVYPPMEKGWECLLENDSTIKNKNLRNIPLEKAENILKNWGIKRIDY